MNTDSVTDGTSHRDDAQEVDYWLYERLAVDRGGRVTKESEVDPRKHGGKHPIEGTTRPVYKDGDSQQ